MLLILGNSPFFLPCLTSLLLILGNSPSFLAQVKSADARAGQSSEECSVVADGAVGREQHQPGDTGGRGESNAGVLRGPEGNGYSGTFQSVCA